VKFKVITLFEDFINRLNEYSIIGRALRDRKIILKAINLREFGLGRYHQVDDRPYGGGIGMLMRVDVLYRALKVAAPRKNKKRLIVLLSADGEKYNQKLAREFKDKYDEIVLICGHYEGFDKRIEKYVDLKLSVGDYVLSGGEIAAMTIIDSISRLVPGVLGKDESSEEETFSAIDGKEILEYPQYTRPYDFKGEKAPDILLSGDHAKIKKWKEKNIRFTS